MFCELTNDLVLTRLRPAALPLHAGAVSLSSRGLALLLSLILSLSSFQKISNQFQNVSLQVWTKQSRCGNPQRQQYQHSTEETARISSDPEHLDQIRMFLTITLDV